MYLPSLSVYMALYAPKRLGFAALVMIRHSFRRGSCVAWATIWKLVCECVHTASNEEWGGRGGGGGLGSPLYVSAKQNVRGCVFVVAVCLVPHGFFSMADEA